MCFLVTPYSLQLGTPQENTGDVRAFLPPAAVVKQELSIDFEHNAKPEIVLLYNVPDTSRAVHGTSPSYYDAGIQILKHSSDAGWSVVFQEPFSGLMSGADEISIEKLTNIGGKEGILVINYHSGAGTVTTWHVLADVAGKIAVVEPTDIRNRILRRRDYADNGYNGVKPKGDLIIEDLTGYSHHAARCCPNRPSLEMSFRFTGSSIALDSVKELPYGLDAYGLPKSHGPLLRLTAKGLWAYAFEVPDGVLVLAGSESPKDTSRSTPAAIVALRKDLLDRGVLGDDGACLVLTHNYKFVSLSTAASVMLGAPANGRTKWRDESGRPARPLRNVNSAR